MSTSRRTDSCDVEPEEKSQSSVAMLETVSAQEISISHLIESFAALFL
jgi:hypothetical protein